jgi:putative membrane protein
MTVSEEKASGGKPGGGHPPLDRPRRTSPLSVGFELAAAAFGALVVLATVSSLWLILILAVSGGLGIVGVVLRWVMRTYTVTEDRLVLDEGVLRRRHRVVPYARVQQVDVTQRLMHRLFDVASLYVETAGESGSTAVELSVLTRTDAEALQAFVLERRQATSRQDVARAEPVAPQRVLAEMSWEDLLLAGATSSGVVIVPAVLAGIGLPWIALGVARGEAPLATGLIAVAVLVAGSLVAAAVVATLSIVSTLLGDWAWTASEHGDDLRVRRGLLELRTQSLPRRRIQRITVIDNPLRRWLGVTSVVLHTAATPGSGHVTTVRVPLVRRSELDAFLRSVMGYTWALPRLLPRSPRARLRAVIRRVAVLGLAFVGPVTVRPGVAWVLAPLALLGIPWGLVAHRRAGLAVTDERVILASGVLHHRIDIAPRNRIQSTRTSSSPFQRQAGLVTLHVDLAGRGLRRLSAHLFDVDVRLAIHLQRTLAIEG